MAGGGRQGADSLLIAALAGGSTVQDAAATAGVGVATVYRRLREREFKQKVEEARTELLSGAMARLSAATTDAVTTLMGLLAAESESVRLGAARSILDMALRWRESADLAERLDAVEAWMETLGDHPGGTKVGRWQRH